MKVGMNTLDRVIKALEANGYDAEGIKSAKFVKFTSSGKEVHKITFPYDDKMDSGHVYLEEKDGKLIGDF